jgi:hypothetical protein
VEEEVGRDKSLCFVWELEVESPEARRKELPKAATRKSAPSASCTLLIGF